MLVGYAGNGKGLFDFLLQTTLGEYMQCPVVQLITTNKHGQLEEPSSAMATCLGALFITMQEPGPCEVINPGIVKELASGDTIMCRYLSMNPISARWSAAMLMSSNKAPPRMRGTHRRVWRDALCYCCVFRFS